MRSRVTLTTNRQHLTAAYNGQDIYQLQGQVFEVGSLFCGVAPSSQFLIVGRAIAGLGSAGLLNGGLTIITACLPKERQASKRILFISSFYVNLPIGGAIPAFLIFVRIPDGTEKPPVRDVLKNVKTLDLVGFALFTPADIILSLALQWGGNEFPWNSATLIGLLAGTVATCAVFFFWESRQRDTAMVPLSVIRQRIVRSSCATMFFNIEVSNCVSYWLPVYFQAVENSSPFMSGVLLLSNILVQSVTVFASGLLAFHGGSELVTAEELGGVLIAYTSTINNVWYLAAGAAAGAFITGMNVGWRDVRKKPESPIPDEG
ncbi:MFS general substrate transporter [Xylaria digitata]|nr:MFS general substrate transporter [Xylaria digitata]